MTEREVFEKAIATYGENAQKLMLIEEMSELTKEICKDFRGGKNYGAIAEEIADVEIMLTQAKMIYDSECEFFTYGFPKLVEENHRYKVERLEKRLEACDGSNDACDSDYRRLKWADEAKRRGTCEGSVSGGLRL